MKGPVYSYYDPTTNKSVDGKLYLDLPGNRVDWFANTAHFDNMFLVGGSFRSATYLPALAKSASSLLAFLGPHAGSLLRVHQAQSVAAALAMELVLDTGRIFFALDLINRIAHELHPIVSIAWIFIDLPLALFSNLADGLLMWYLLNHTPVQIRNKTGWAHMVGLTMIVAWVLFGLIAIASRRTQTWKLLTVTDMGGDAQTSDPNTLQALAKSRRVFNSVDSATAGMLLFFSIGFAWHAVAFLRRMEKSRYAYTRICWLVLALALAFLARNSVVFAFTLYYSECDHIAGITVQLVNILNYGVCSMVVYWTIFLLAMTEGKDDMANTKTGYVQVVGKESTWQAQEQEQVPMISGTAQGWPLPQGYQPVYNGQNTAYGWNNVHAKQ